VLGVGDVVGVETAFQFGDVVEDAFANSTYEMGRLKCITSRFTIQSA